MTYYQVEKLTRSGKWVRVSPAWSFRECQEWSWSALTVAYAPLRIVEARS